MQHKFWRALRMQASGAGTLELSEFQLYNGASRVDASATLTSSVAPTSGSLANLHDDSTTTGAYWSSGGEDVILQWEFASKTNVDGIVLGSRTTASRYPGVVVLQGGDVPPGGSTPEWTTYIGFGALRFTSATKTSIMTGRGVETQQPVIGSSFDFYTPGGVGRVPFTVKLEVLPRTTPRTYVPKFAKVRLERDIDGKVIRQAWSDPVTGEGAFENVDENFTYTVTAIDPLGQFRAVIGDRIKPEGYPV